MAYTKTLWKNRLVERPRTFRFQQNADGSVTLNPEEGQIIEAGTPVNAEKLNKIEDALETHETQLGEMTSLQTSVKTNLVGAINELNTGKQSTLPVENRRKITFGTANPTGGVNGDIYFQYV